MSDLEVAQRIIDVSVLRLQPGDVVIAHLEGDGWDGWPEDQDPTTFIGNSLDETFKKAGHENVSFMVIQGEYAAVRFEIIRPPVKT